MIKPHFNRLATAITWAFIACSIHASVPLRWTVETSRANVETFDAYHGETLDLDAALLSYGTPLPISGDARLFYQTNGMDSAWWSVPATIAATNHLRASFAPASDPGAQQLNCFLGVTGSIYRAAFRIRFRNSPGATPNVLPLPVVSYDARLNGNPTINGTNLTEWVAARSQAESDPLAAGIATNVVTNIVNRSYVEALGITGSAADSIDFSRVSTTNAAWLPMQDQEGWSINWVDGYLNLYASMKNDWDDGCYTLITDKFFGIDWDDGTTKYEHDSIIYNPKDDSLPIVHYHFPHSPPYLSSDGIDKYSVLATNATGIALSPEHLVPIITTQALDHATIAAWETYWDGDDVRVTVTNYDSQVHMPSLYLEQNTNTTAGASPAYRVVWDERTRWDSFLAGYNSFTNNAAQNYADRAWGVYDSATGAFSPDNLLQVSQEQIMIANGLAYQKTITTGGCALWVLQANDPTTVTGVTSNGFFRITDGDGNSLFEIVKGDKRIVGATASSIVANNGMTITYNVVSGNHPTLELTTDLTNGPWLDETECSSIATVTWTGSSGAWVANVALVGVQTRMFAKASYEIGGDTYIKNTAPLGFSRIYIDGTNYTVHVEMMNGKKVLVLQ